MMIFLRKFKSPKAKMELTKYGADTNGGAEMSTVGIENEFCRENQSFETTMGRPRNSKQKQKVAFICTNILAVRLSVMRKTILIS